MQTVNHWPAVGGEFFLNKSVFIKLLRLQNMEENPGGKAEQ